MAVPPEKGKFIYHLTCVDNLETIITHGLRPRNKISNFTDVADPEIITHRDRFGLNDYIPFHFFAGNPFDGIVQLTHPELDYILLAVRRTIAREKNFKILPTHPVYFEHNYRQDYPQCFCGEKIIPLDYDKGMSTIDWEAMNSRDYSDPYIKNVCMAECLYKPEKSGIRITSFDIYVPNPRVYNKVVALLESHNIPVEKMRIYTNNYMFKSGGDRDDQNDNRRYIEI